MNQTKKEVKEFFFFEEGESSDENSDEERRDVELKNYSVNPWPSNSEENLDMLLKAKIKSS